MRLAADLHSLVPAAGAIEDLTDFGVNANTAKIDERAWLMWEHICQQLGTNPLRSAAEVSAFPQRQTFVLASLLLYAFVTGTPRDSSRQFIKPRSALAYPLAIIRIFGRWGIQLPGYKALVAEMNGMMRLYLRYHGPHSLAPRRAEPMRWQLVQKINSIPCDGRRTFGATAPTWCSSSDASASSSSAQPFALARSRATRQVRSCTSHVHPSFGASTASGLLPQRRNSCRACCPAAMDAASPHRAPSRTSGARSTAPSPSSSSSLPLPRTRALPFGTWSYGSLARTANILRSSQICVDSHSRMVSSTPC
jgi:hypothetical protein